MLPLVSLSAFLHQSIVLIMYLNDILHWGDGFYCKHHQPIDNISVSLLLLSVNNLPPVHCLSLSNPVLDCEIVLLRVTNKKKENLLQSLWLNLLLKMISEAI